MKSQNQKKTLKIYSKSFQFFDKAVTCNCRKEEGGVVVNFFSSKQQGKTTNFTESRQEVIYNNNGSVEVGVSEDYSTSTSSGATHMGFYSFR
jgi:hypothetical protein